MSINRAEQRLEDKPAVIIKGLEKDLRELKTTTQKLGADALTTVGFPDYGALSAGPLSLAAGGSGTFNVTFNPAAMTLTLWNFLFSVNVDVNDGAHQFPAGSSLTSGQRNMVVTGWPDWGDSSDVSNVRVFKVRIYNNDLVNPHDYYLKIRAYLPLLAVS